MYLIQLKNTTTHQKDKITHHNQMNVASETNWLDGQLSEKCMQVVD